MIVSKTLYTFACAALGLSALFLAGQATNGERAEPHSEGASASPAVASRSGFASRPPLPSQHGKSVVIGPKGPVLIATSAVSKAIAPAALVRPEGADYVLYGPIGGAGSSDGGKPSLRMPMRFADDKELQKFLEGGDARLTFVGELPAGYSVAAFEKSFVLVECQLKVKLPLEDGKSVERPIPLPVDRSDSAEVTRMHTPYVRATLDG